MRKAKRDNPEKPAEGDEVAGPKDHKVEMIVHLSDFPRTIKDV